MSGLGLVSAAGVLASVACLRTPSPGLLPLAVDLGREPVARSGLCSPDLGAPPSGALGSEAFAGSGSFSSPGFAAWGASVSVNCGLPSPLVS
jgi:hypothetical protein